MRLMIMVLGVLLAASFHATADTTADKARLQAAMQQYIQRSLVDGVVLQLDTATGQVRQLYPTQAHPMVIAMGDHYVLCTDLRDKSGNVAPLDLYMTPNGRSFTVFHAEIGNRAPLKKFMKDGLARPLR